MERSQAPAHETAPAPGGPLPTPPDFPIVWEQPGDERAFWTIDRMHFPDQIPPLVDSFLRVFMEDGFASGFARYGVPLSMHARRFNTYHYDATIPDDLSPEEAAAAGQRTEEALGAAVGRLGATWREEWLPAVQRHLAAWAAFDLPGASLAELRAELDATMARFHELAEIHFQVVIPQNLSLSIFQDLYRDLFTDDDPFNAHRLLQGLGNETVRANRELWQLSRQALAVPAVRKVIEERPAAEVVDILSASPEGRDFLVAFRAYLDEQGRRGSTWFDLDQPSWHEDPTPVVETLKGFVANPAFDLEAQEASLVAEREQLTAQARERLQGYPQQVQGQFEHLLQAARDGALLSEDHGHYIDWRGAYYVRQVLLECERRLVEAGVIAAPGDLFMLTYAEVVDALAALPGGDLRALVAERQDEMARFSTITPPPAVGTPPPGPPPDNPMMRALGRFFGGPPPTEQEPGLVRGNAGSSGKATGRAVVVRSLDDAGRVRAGDILVAEMTAPPWTPLFATVAAVVTDTGGILSHTAVVAREYRIPAVVGTGMATARIADGALIEVDGDAGTVRILA